MWTMKAENKMPERRDKRTLQEGFTLLELVIATAIIGIVAAVAVPQYSAYKTRAYDTTTQSTLHSVFTACKDYWTFNSSNSPCLLTTLSNNEHGFTPSATIEVTIDSDANNTEYDFSATAHHTSSSSIYGIDHRGVVSLVYGGGCSEPANIDSKKLKKNATGGCGTTTSKPGSKSNSKSKP